MSKPSARVAHACAALALVLVGAAAAALPAFAQENDYASDEAFALICSAVSAGTADGRTESVHMSVGGPAEKVLILGADELNLMISARGVKTSMPWKRVKPAALYSLGLKYLPLDDAFVHLCLAQFCADRGLTADAQREAAQAARLDPELKADADDILKNAKPSASSGGAAAATAPEGSSRRKEKTLKTKLVRALLSFDLKSVNESLGPRPDDDKSRDEVKLPEIHLKHADGEYKYKIETVKDPVDYTGHAGQVLYVPIDNNDAGVDRMRFCQSWHENHGGKNLWHVYALGPTMKDWFCKSPDPGVKRADWMSASKGRLARPVAVARGHVEWSNCGIMAFPNGVVGASGYGNNDDKYPFTTLPKGLVPTAAAVTPNNELALITACEPSTLKSYLAVVALESRALRHHTFPYAGLPNVGTHTRLKLLGLVELPQISAPTRVSATCNVSRWRWTTEVSNEALDSAEARQKWYDGVDEHHQAATAGYAVVVSRGENKVAFVDLGPLFRYFYAMYFTTEKRFKETTNEGDAPDQWPYTFAHEPKAAPKVVSVTSIPSPSAVATGVRVNSNRDFHKRAYVATEDGRLIVYDVSSLVDPATPAGAPVPVGQIKIGKNPTSIAYGRDQARAEHMIITCRADRSIVWVEPAGNSGRVIRRLQDDRLKDPVFVEGWDSRGASGISVADFAGKQVVNYLVHPISAWGDRIFGGLGEDGEAEFECTGVRKLDGYPFMLSFAEIN